MIRKAIVTLAVFLVSSLFAKQVVVCVHGLKRTSSSMKKMAKYLSKEGFDVVNIDYPSDKLTVEELAQKYISPVVDSLWKMSYDKINFVTHSMGGILVRYYLQDHSLPNGSRIVMLSPPNNGSEVTDKLKDWRLYQIWNGPAGMQLGTDSLSVPNKLSSIDFEIGIITGSKTLEPWLSVLIPGKDDGKVSVESAKLSEMSDFLVIHDGHTFIMMDKDVIKQTVHFLREGKFNNEE